MLNQHGGIECDLTVIRQEVDRFYIITGTGFATHDFDWIERNILADCDAHLVDVTSSKSVLSLMGPNARNVLQELTSDAIDHSSFPFGTARTLHLAGAPVLAVRLTYVGELGWELHIPVEYALTVYDALMKAGQSYGLENAGYRAIESLRLEKGYRAWGSDIGPDHTPLEAGMGWATKLKTGLDFQGKNALLKQKKDGLRKRLACFTVEDKNCVLLGRETIYRNGERVGWLTSAGYGYTVDKPIGYGYVRNPEGVDLDFLKSGEYELEVATERVKATIHLSALYDPKQEKIRR